MSEIKWIKITTGMFDDEKIKLIESMPDADTVLIIWIKLLTQAGKCNTTGYLLLNNKIPYTDEMLATIFNRPLATVKMALQIFKNFEMIDLDDESFHITNWEKHQNIEGMEKIRQQTRERVAEHRTRKKQMLLEQNCNVTSNVTVTESNMEITQQNKNKNKNKKEEKEKELKEDICEIPEENSEPIVAKRQPPIPYQDIINLFHDICISYSKVLTLSNTRKKVLGTWYKELGMEGIECVFRKAQESDFLKGNNNRGWKADFDWIIKPDKRIKILEGSYDNKNQGNQENKSDVQKFKSAYERAKEIQAQRGN